ncbi:hypothetical protein PLUTE_a3600 [Pseudoalteromonas luteoviolacea DSM 6061]|nr:hypothetical protein [Pseudoalteromonas luteoviolacea DSM 6061]
MPNWKITAHSLAISYVEEQINKAYSASCELKVVQDPDFAYATKA